MIELYVKLIISKRRSLEQVPLKIRAEVKAKLSEYGYDINGDPLPI